MFSINCFNKDYLFTKGLFAADSGMVEKKVFSNGIQYVRFGKGGDILLVLSGGPNNTLSSGFTYSGFWSIQKSVQSYIVTCRLDLLVVGKAEMVNNSKNRFVKIKAPTLVHDGEKDYYCPVGLLRETACGTQMVGLSVTKARVTLSREKSFMRMCLRL